MKIRYHSLCDDYGVVILESEPQMRNLHTYGNKGILSKRYPFPYINFIVRYIKKGNKFVYPGIGKAGLFVYFRNEPITSLKDHMLLSPTDHIYGGLVCTDHTYDSKCFSNLDDLLKCVVGLWWGTLHAIQYQPFESLGKYWDKATFDELPKAKWLSTKHHFVTTMETYGRGNFVGNELEKFRGGLPLDATLISKDWPSTKIDKPTIIPFDYLKYGSKLQTINDDEQSIKDDYHYDDYEED